MKRLAFCALLLILGTAQQAAAAGVVRIADGDCAALAAAAAATPGQEPALIVLANKGIYDNGNFQYCQLTVNGNITIDGAGATILLPDMAENLPPGPDIIVRPGGNLTRGGNLTLRNLNLGFTTTGGASAKANAKSTPAQPKFISFYSPQIANAGTLTLDTVTVSGVTYSYNATALIANSGNLILRNVSIANNVTQHDRPDGSGAPLIDNTGNVDISHATLASNQLGADGLLFSHSTGTIKIANSVLANSGGPNCNGGAAAGIASRGGNITNDVSCGFAGPNDRVVANVRLLDFGTHGGVVGTLALNYDSPAIGNGLLANCEATDARGLARGQDRCDSGAYEIGGGNGKLSATGMSGLYFNAANNGHYVSIQRLYGNDALVIWNTFDQHGTPAWLYGVGTVAGDKIHVDQVAQNVGGTLHAGGGVTGATPTLWGTLDVDLSDCYTASLSYSSPLPQFGSGSTSLQRLAFLDGVNCAH